MKRAIFWVVIIGVIGVVLYYLIQVGDIVVPNISRIGCQPACEKVHQ